MNFSEFYIIPLMVIAFIFVYIILVNFPDSKETKLKKTMYSLLSKTIKNSVDISEFKDKESTHANSMQKFDEEIQFLFNKACEFNGIEGDLNLLIKLLENYVYIVTLKGMIHIKKLYKEQLNELEFNFIKDYIAYIKKTNIFFNISNKQRIFLSNLYRAIETNNVDLGKTVLNQLYEETEKSLNEYDKKDKKAHTLTMASFILGIIGIVLTIAFGVIPLI